MTGCERVTAETISDEQLYKLRDENIANGWWDFARRAIGEACIPFENSEYSGYRRPSAHEQYNARGKCAALLNERNARPPRHAHGGTVSVTGCMIEDADERAGKAEREAARLAKELREAQDDQDACSRLWTEQRDALRDELEALRKERDALREAAVRADGRARFDESNVIVALDRAGAPSCDVKPGKSTSGLSVAGRIAELAAQRDTATTALSAAEGKVERLRELLREACDLADDAVAIAPRSDVWRTSHRELIAAWRKKGGL
jgi:hypothetical protein